MLFGDTSEGSKFSKAGIGQNNMDSALHLINAVVQTIKVDPSSNVSLNAGYVAATAFTASSSSFWRRPVMTATLPCSLCMSRFSCRWPKAHSSYCTGPFITARGFQNSLGL